MNKKKLQVPLENKKISTMYKMIIFLFQAQMGEAND